MYLLLFIEPKRKIFLKKERKSKEERGIKHRNQASLLGTINLNNKKRSQDLRIIQSNLFVLIGFKWTW